MAKKEKLTRQDSGIALNIAIELMPELSAALGVPGFPLITEIKSWYEKELLKDSKNASSMELAYSVAAAIRAAVKMVYHDNIHKLEVDKWVKVPQEEHTLESTLKLASTIVRAAVAKY